MIARLFVSFALVFASPPVAAWQSQAIDTAAPVRELVEIDGVPHIRTASGWFRALASGKAVRLETAGAPRPPALPPDALPDARIAVGKQAIARA